MIKIIFTILLVLLIATSIYGYTTSNKRILILDKEYIDLTVMSVMSGAKRILEQLIIEKKIVIISSGVKIDILNEYKKNIYRVKAGSQEGYMIISERLLRNKNEFHTKAQ